MQHCTYFLLYPFVITLQDWSVNYVRKLKCQPCVEAAQQGIASVTSLQLLSGTKRIIELFISDLSMPNFYNSLSCRSTKFGMQV